MRVDGLIGAQYGSEGKGAVAAAIADCYDAHVRVGAPNAGHTFYHEGKKFVARSVPCGWVNPNAKIYIGAGAILDLELLLDEIEEIEEAGYEIRNRLYVDSRASVLLRDHHAAEGGIEGEAHRAIGSTGEGVGITRIAKISRGVLVPNLQHVAIGDVTWDTDPPFMVQPDTFLDLLHHKEVLIEGAQGSGLSLTHGVWPYCTSTDTNFAQMLSDVGLAPCYARDAILVARTFPIRVAGNSGPLAGETSWEAIGIPEERTTVTKKVRRVGTWDEDMLLRAIRLNGSERMAITFLDYTHPETTGQVYWDEMSHQARKWVTGVESRLGVEAFFLGTGPNTAVLR